MIKRRAAEVRGRSAEPRDAPWKGDCRQVNPDMRVSFAGLVLVNPIIAASGTFGYGVEFEEIVSLERLGAIVTKGDFSGADGGATLRRGWCIRRRGC